MIFGLFENWKETLEIDAAFSGGFGKIVGVQIRLRQDWNSIFKTGRFS
jgi:hypothetical protein